MNNNKLNKVKEIYKILDPNYFHLCIEDDGENEIKWSVFYNNLSTEDYFSEKNEPLLTSEKNVIGNIYQLNKKFENEKNKIFNDNLLDYIKSIKSSNKIIETAHSMLIKIITVCVIITIINLFIKHSFWSTSICLIFSASTFIIGQDTLKKIDKLFNKNNKEQYIKALTRNFDFVERLRLWN